MPQLWQFLSAHLHTFVGLLDDAGDISSALVITMGAVKVALACIRRLRRRHITSCSVQVPRRRRRRQCQPQHEPCQRPHAAVRTGVRYRTDPPAPDRPSVA